MEKLLEIICLDDLEKFEECLKDGIYMESIKQKPQLCGYQMITPINSILAKVPAGLKNYYYFLKRLIDEGAYFEYKEPYSIGDYGLAKDEFRTNFVYQICLDKLSNK